MSEDRFEEFMRAWLEADSAQAGATHPKPAPSCVTFAQAFDGVREGTGRAGEIGNEQHVSQCQYCAKVLRLFGSALKDSGAKSEGLRRLISMAVGQSWEKISEGLVRLREPIELFMAPEGGLSTEPVPGHRRRAVQTELTEYPSEVESSVAIPDTHTTIELAFARGSPSAEVALRVRQLRLGTTKKGAGCQLVFRRETGEEVRSAWLEEGEVVTIPRVAGGEFVLSLADEEVGTTYEIPIVMTSYTAPR